MGSIRATGFYNALFAGFQWQHHNILGRSMWVCVARIPTVVRMCRSAMWTTVVLMTWPATHIRPSWLKVLYTQTSVLVCMGLCTWVWCLSVGVCVGGALNLQCYFSIWYQGSLSLPPSLLVAGTLMWIEMNSTDGLSTAILNVECVDHSAEISKAETVTRSLIKSTP